MRSRQDCQLCTVRAETTKLLLFLMNGQLHLEGSWHWHCSIRTGETIMQLKTFFWATLTSAALASVLFLLVVSGRMLVRLLIV